MLILPCFDGLLSLVLREVGRCPGEGRGQRLLMRPCGLGEPWARCALQVFSVWVSSW